MRVAADGVRIALVVEKGDERSLLVGRIERGRTGRRDRVGRRTAVTVRELQVRDARAGAGHRHVLGRGQPARGRRPRARGAWSR
ncbi:LpqB family beta-propeller domain-containing protein [Streptomyces prasinosporus]|uniref:LpqB family beta-propeller domain-containing protein n=1 Tax=Streptomyces prasinosporus TaxID=68256 RepID=UPI0031EA5172